MAKDLNNQISTLVKNNNINQATLIDAINATLPPDRKLVISSTDSFSTSTTNDTNITPRSKVFGEFDYNDDVVITEQRITEGLFYGTGSISTFVTASDQSTTSLEYYYKVQDSLARDIFDVAWGNLSGTSASIANYKQMKNILLSPTSNKFSFNSTDANAIGIIAIDRAIMKERLDAGNWQLTINSKTLIDNSGATGSSDFSTSGEKYSIYEGTIAAGVTGTQEWGTVYLDQGVFIFDSTILSTSASVTSAQTLFNQISVFQARNERYLKDTNYYVRLKNRDFNYSNNPTFYTASTGALHYDAFVNDPHTYPTTIGLYNDKNELLAVARLSKPVEKTFSKEALIQVKLSF